MSNTTADTPSVADRARPIAVGGAVVNIHFLKRTAGFVLGEEALVLWDEDAGEPHRCAIHGGAILSSAADGTCIVTGGDDGKVVVTDASGTSAVAAADPKQRWIDHVAIAQDGALAWSVGKQAFVRVAKAKVQDDRSLEVLSTVGALAFSPKGFRLAIAHYNGATLWFPNAKADPERLEWKGSHLVASFSPDGRFLVTAMQESMLHGWRLIDRKDMRMQGYAERVRSLDWTHDGKWLATSGSNQLILWPFQAKDGPMGKAPQIMAQTEHQVEVVACHPRHPITAVGYADGMVMLVRIDDGAEILAKRPGDAPVTALGWSSDGALLAFGTDSGEAGVLDLG